MVLEIQQFVILVYPHTITTDISSLTVNMLRGKYGMNLNQFVNMTFYFN